ncbi:PEP-CTERM sorting domain-containing protein [Thalassotalea euphylliae]|uniref:PEP-CTERM sorting domain-containing protein n=1 Tax=Thalassotalea euphylliae TaxID=1655234 RepID=A0A3E0U2U7_9GAMM|nr:PEP-CTERM sorting domain-containing protein [Thalassotalea euphylliae]REL30883.1 PEP-CTERM sorting domain-containing protein [Thalassotalea euphylliae]
MTSNTSLKVVNKKGNALKLSSFWLASFKLGLGIMLSIASLVSPTSSAGLISDYSLDSDSNIVTDSGNNLEWLQWSVTDGMSIDQALSTYANDGWQLASTAQMSDLFNTFDFSYGQFTWGEGGEVDQSHNSGSDGRTEAADDRELMFVSLFGNTYLEFSLNENGLSMQYAGALFGFSGGDDYYKIAFVRDDFDFERGIMQDYNGATAVNYREFLTDGFREDLGVALVRSTESTAVPEPAPLVLVAFGLIALVCTRRAKPLS